MKNKFINFASIFFFAITSLLVVSCDNDDLVPEFTIQPSSEEVNFQNTFTDQYLLSKETKNNIAERFVWNAPNFGVPTEISYLVEGSISEDFATIDFESGTLNATNYAVSVGNLLTIAQDLLLLDTDPTTMGDDGEPNNLGTIYFRIKAFPGTGEGANALEKVSEIINLNISLIEDTITSGGSGIEVSDWSLIGSAITGNDDGWGIDLPLYSTNESDVFVAYVTLLDGKFKIRKDKDWAEAYGIDGADIEIAAGNYKIMFDYNTTTVSFEEFSWGIVGSATPIGWPGDNTPDDEQLKYDFYTNTWKVAIYLTAEEGDAIKFRKNNDWGTNYGYSGTEGTLGGDDIPISEAGNYIVTVDFNTSTYTLESIDNIWGIVGDATPIGWPGDNTPDDAKLTPDYSTTNVWVMKNFPLKTGGFIKFRANNDWGTNYGYNGTEGTLGGDDIPVTEGGYYNVTLNLSDLTYELVKVANLSE